MLNRAILRLLAPSSAPRPGCAALVPRLLIPYPGSAILNATRISAKEEPDVVGIGQAAMGAAPVFGGAMLAIAAGQFRGPDFRGTIKQDMDLLDRLPPDATERRANLQRSIDDRIDDLVDAADRGRMLRKAATSYHGNWRDVVLFACAVLFTIVWWHVKHERANWLPTFIVLIVFSVVTAGYAALGAIHSTASLLRRRPPGQDLAPRS
jgi:hypothetical protein